jgi:general secretion pathway protein G
MLKYRAVRQTGFTLIELLIVMVILGLLASLVGPRLFGHLGASKTKAAKAQIEMLGTALDSYRLDVGRYPLTDQGLLALWEKPANEADGLKWRGPYLKKKVDKDPWGNDYVYRSPGAQGTPREYEIVSYGADGKEGGSGEDADVNSWE